MGMKFTLVLDDIPTEWIKREIRDHIIRALDRASKDIPYVEHLGVYQNIEHCDGDIIGRYAVKNADGSIPRGV